MKAPVTPLARVLFDDKKASKYLFEFILDKKSEPIRVSSKDGDMTVVARLIKRT